jgi:hypothetical protein
MKSAGHENFFRQYFPVCKEYLFGRLMAFPFDGYSPHVLGMLSMLNSMTEFSTQEIL